MQEIHDYLVREEESGLVLSLEDSKQQLFLPGVLVEKGFKLANGESLWLTNNDSPYEETLFVSLVNSKNLVVDKLELFKPYTPGILNEVVVGDSSIQFEFWAEETHQVAVGKDKKLRFSHLFSEAGCYYLSKFMPSRLSISTLEK
ncbi:hypothetical protein AHAT_09870 [Agarivorans sp. Toyoura001]|uniref:hypothetical protein n=1 Tax=Agarivorans sp. Toyoura001 TaxID=2283141 RepID=UPI0010DC35F4|nr:hypothetical protein [Agarivorans sp. Toyoura001]GDY25097.1 hypothetical protein AHAT_09870 [Agarivorans sp. Toyoura001]